MNGKKHKASTSFAEESQRRNTSHITLGLGTKNTWSASGNAHILASNTWFCRLDVWLKIFGFVAPNTAARSPDVSFKISSFIVVTAVNQLRWFLAWLPICKPPSRVARFDLCRPGPYESIFKKEANMWCFEGFWKHKNDWFSEQIKLWPDKKMKPAPRHVKNTQIFSKLCQKKNL